MRNVTTYLIATDPLGSSLMELGTSGGRRQAAYTPLGYRPPENFESSTGYTGKLLESIGWYINPHGGRAYNPALGIYHSPASRGAAQGGMNTYTDEGGAQDASQSNLMVAESVVAIGTTVGTGITAFNDFRDVYADIRNGNGFNIRRAAGGVLSLLGSVLGLTGAVLSFGVGSPQGVKIAVAASSSLGVIRTTWGQAERLNRPAGTTPTASGVGDSSGASVGGSQNTVPSSPVAAHRDSIVSISDYESAVGSPPDSRRGSALSIEVQHTPPATEPDGVRNRTPNKKSKFSYKFRFRK